MTTSKKILSVQFHLTNKEIAILRDIAKNPWLYKSGEIELLDDLSRKLIRESFIIKGVNLTYDEYRINPLIAKYFIKT